MRTHWTNELIVSQLREISNSLGRMPSVNELKALGKNDLSCALIRRGGCVLWADRLGLSLKGTETHRGQAVEAVVKQYLTELGFSVERQTARAPFDLLVNNKVKVDVKSAKYGEYKNKKGRHECRGFIFGLQNKKLACDLYILCGVDGGNAVLWRYFIPADAARVSMITITENGKYSKFKEDVGQIQALIDSQLPSPKGDGL